MPPAAYERLPLYAEDDISDAFASVGAELDIKLGQRRSRGSSVGFQNQLIDLEQLVVNSDFIDEAVFTRSQRKALKSSILDAELLVTMTDEEAERAASRDAKLKQVLLFLLAAAITVWANVTDEWAMIDPKTGLRHATWLLRMPGITSMLLSSVFAMLAAPMIYGGREIASVLDFRAITVFMPMAIAYCVYDMTATRVMFEVGGSMWRVMTQLRLMMVALGSWLFLGRELTGTQWLLLITISFSVAAFSLAGLQSFAIPPYSSLLKGILMMLLITAAGLLSENALKQDHGHYIVQFGRARICGLIFSIPMLVLDLEKNNLWHLFPFGGWRRSTPMLVVTDLARGWVSMLIIKQLDTIWKMLASSLALVFSYLLNVYLQPIACPFRMGQFLTLVCVVLDIIAFASAKQDEQKLLQLAATASRRGAFSK